MYYLKNFLKKLRSFLTALLTIGWSDAESATSNRATVFTNAVCYFSFITVIGIYMQLDKLGVDSKYIQNYYFLSLIVVAVVFLNWRGHLLAARILLTFGGFANGLNVALIWGKTFNGHYMYFITIIYSILAFSDRSLLFRVCVVLIAFIGLPLADVFYYYDILPVTNLNSKDLPIGVLLSDTFIIPAFIIAVVWIEKQMANRHEAELQVALASIKELSEKDPVTALANRRHFNETLKVEFLRAQNRRVPLSVIMLDIDFFKQYNDAYGHQAGDHCLRLVADTLKATLKNPKNMVARFGGEEFIAVLPDAERSQALAIAEALRKSVESKNIRHAPSTGTSHVTISVGVTTHLPEASDSSEDLIKHADIALYEAKRLGRNQVCAFESTQQVLPRKNSA